MSFVRPSSALVLLAGILVLSVAAQAQTRPAASSDDARKVVKRVQTAPPQPAAPRTVQASQETAKDAAAQTDMIMLQEPFRGGAAMPVSITHGR